MLYNLLLSYNIIDLEFELSFAIVVAALFSFKANFLANWRVRMPRRLPVRPQVIIGNIFVVLVSWVIGIIYYAYVFLVWLPKAEGKFMNPLH